MRIPFAQIDAFADAAFTGNPAAVMPLTSWPEDRLLQQIAEENNLSETAFLVPDASGDGDFELRWFTPAAEVALCGHATLASGHFVLSSDGDRDSVRFRTRQAGVLEVARAEGAVGASYAMALPAWKPEPRAMPEIVAALGVEAVETLWHEKGYALVIVADEAAVRAATPDGRAVKALGPFVHIVAARGRDHARARGPRQDCRGGQPRLHRLFRHPGGSGDRFRARGDGAVLGGAARPRLVRRVPGERAGRTSGLPARRRARDPAR